MRQREGQYHPTQKPVALMRWCLSKLSLPRGSVIYDPYMGSGPVGIACMQLGYQYVGVEIDPNYFAIAEKRISQAALQPGLFITSSNQKQEPKQHELFGQENENDTTSNN